MCFVIILGACSAAPAGPPPAPSAPAADSAPDWEPPARESPRPSPPASGPQTVQDRLDDIAGAAESVFAMPIITPSDESGRRLIYNISMRLQTSEFEPGIVALRNTVYGLGGHTREKEIIGHDMRAPYGNRQADFIFRIPTENLTEFIVMVENNYNIWRLRMSVQDETVTYQRTDFDLQELRDLEDQLFDLLGQAQDDEEIDEILDAMLELFALQDELAHVRRQISEVEISQAQLMDAVIYSTVEIVLLEAFYVEIAPPTFGDRMRREIASSLAGVAAFAQGFVIFIIVVTPILLLLALCTGLVFFIIRMINKISKSKKLARYLSGEKSTPKPKIEDSNGENTPPPSEHSNE